MPGVDHPIASVDDLGVFEVAHGNLFPRNGKGDHGCFAFLAVELKMQSSIDLITHESCIVLQNSLNGKKPIFPQVWPQSTWRGKSCIAGRDSGVTIDYR